MIYQTPAVALATLPDAANAGWIGWRNVLTVANVAADQEADGFPAVNLANPSTAEKWKGTSTAAQGVIIHEGGMTECDYFALAKHNLGSSGATFKLQSSPDAVTWTDVTEETAPADDKAVMYRFAAETAAFWRLYITPGTEAPQIAVMYLGKLLILQRKIYVGHTPLVLGRSQNNTIGKSDNGQFLGLYLRSQFLESTVALDNLTPGWYRTEFDPFAEASVNTPFFWAWRPGSYPLEVGYAWVKGGMTPSNSKPNGMMQISFSMEGVR
jgi:hypothetical protein